MSIVKSEIRNAIDSLDIDRARKLLSEAMRSSPDADVYYLASLVALDEEQRINFLQKAISIDPNHQSALNNLSKHQNPSLNFASDVQQDGDLLDFSLQRSEQERHFVLARVSDDDTFLYEIPTWQATKVGKLITREQLIVIPNFCAKFGGF